MLDHIKEHFKVLFPYIKRKLFLNSAHLFNHIVDHRLKGFGHYNAFPATVNSISLALDHPLLLHVLH